MCARTESCSEIVAGRDESFIEHLKATGCPECFEIARRILHRAAKEGVDGFLESLKPSRQTIPANHS
jgi:hypothetical protein